MKDIILTCQSRKEQWERKGPARGYKIHVAGIREVHQLDFTMITNKPHVSEVCNHKFCLAHRSSACLQLCLVLLQVSSSGNQAKGPSPTWDMLFFWLRAETQIYGEVSSGPAAQGMLRCSVEMQPKLHCLMPSTKESNTTEQLTHTHAHTCTHTHTHTHLLPLRGTRSGRNS